jgi:hypothetical protein
MLLDNDDWEEELDSGYLTQDSQLETGSAEGSEE